MAAAEACTLLAARLHPSPPPHLLIPLLSRRYADEYGLAVLLVNQIVDSVGDGRGSGGLAALPAQPRAAAAKNTGHTGGLRLASLGREVVPALGLAWANCVNTRLFLSRCAAVGSAEPARFHGAPSAAAAAAAAAGDAAAGGGAPALRKLQVVFSPHLPQRECYYVVEATGVRGLAPEELEQHEAAAVQAAWEQQRAWQWQQEQEQQRAQAAAGGAPWSQQQQHPQHPQQQQHQHGRQWNHQQQQNAGQWGQQPLPAQHQQQQQRQQQQWGAPPPQQQPQQSWGQQQLRQFAGQQQQLQPQQSWGQQQAAPQAGTQQWHPQGTAPAHPRHNQNQQQPQQQHNQPSQNQQQRWPQQWQPSSGTCAGGGGGSGAWQQPVAQQQVRQPLQPQQHVHSGW